MVDLLISLLDVERFMPHGMCILWDPLLVWTFVVSDIAIAISYFAIPLALIYYLAKRQDVQFSWLGILFSGFILACGTLHVLEAVIIWKPYYNLVAVMKVITMLVSVMTAIAVWRVMPRLLAIPSAKQFESMNRVLEIDAVQGKANLAEEIRIRLEKDKKIRCLYAISDSIRVKESIEDVIQDTVMALPGACRHPDRTRAQVQFNNVVNSSAGFNEAAHRLSSKITVGGEAVGSVEIGYLGGLSLVREDVSVQEEQELIDTIAGLIGETIERRETADLLLRSELIVSCSIDMLALIDTNYHYMAANPAYLNNIGKSPQEVIGLSMSSVLGETTFASVIKPNADRCMAGQAVRYQRWLDLQTGERRYMDVSYSPFIKDHQVAGFIVDARDVTESKALEDEKERLLSAIEQTAEGVVITDIDGTIEYVNLGFEKITGYPRQEAIGKNPRFLKSGVQEAVFYQDMWDTLLRGENWVNQLINRKKDGTLYHEEMVISPVRDVNKKTVNYVAVKRDITAEIELAQQLTQAQKMDAIGRLAGGVAHDFNNSLGVIIGYTDMSLEAVEPSQAVHANLTEIRNAAERSMNLTRQLLAFARQQSVFPVVLDLNETVAGMLNMLKRLIGENIELTWLPGSEVSAIKMDQSQIDQILANLCINARDAIEGNGKIVIETGNTVLDDDYCISHPGATAGNYVRLTITDDGCGMNEETLNNIYEPFYTTKEQGKGTGLGLATIYGIVKQNGGFINVESSPGDGTVCSIYLHQHEGQVKKEPSTNSSAGLTPDQQGQETILLVEDEAPLLRIITRMLESQGYTVLVASSPGEALRLADLHGGDIDLLLTDVIMPEMTGVELAKKISNQHPGLKKLIMSGYTADGIINVESLDGDAVHFLQKPFSNKELSQKIRDVLDKK